MKQLQTHIPTFLSYLILAKVCDCASMFALSSKRSKCFSLQSAVGSTLSIEYTTPDLVVLPPDDSPRASHPNRDPHHDPRHPFDGMHAIQERMKNYQEKRQLMQRNPEKKWNTKNPEVISNLSITVENLGPPSGKAATSSPINSVHELHKRSQTTRQTFTVDKAAGHFRFKLTDYDNARICVESITASPLKPNFFSLRVKEIDGDVTEELRRHEENEKQLENNERRAKEFLYWVERELTRLIDRAKSIERGMQAGRATHSDFHQQSVYMQRTLMWFPWVQILVTLVTATLVAKSLSKYLKKKGVIF